MIDCGGGRCATLPRERVDVYKSRCVTRYILFSRQHNYATGLDVVRTQTRRTGRRLQKRPVVK